jgi:hypothetical protein
MAIKKIKDVDSAEDLSNQDLHKESVINESYLEEEGSDEANAELKPVVEEKEVAFDNKKEEGMLTKSDVEEMLARITRENDEKMRRMFATMQGKKNVSDEGDYVDDIINDWNEQPSIFFSYSHHFSISGDKKRGIESAPPHGVVKFKPLIRSQRKTGKNTQVISVCSVKVNSQKEVDYLRNHSQFGVRFFESMENAMSVDVSWAQKLVESNSQIQQLSDMQVIDRSSQEGLTIISDISVMRKNLIEHVAKKNIAQEEKLRNNNLRQAVKDTDTGRMYVEKTI